MATRSNCIASRSARACACAVSSRAQHTHMCVMRVAVRSHAHTCTHTQCLLTRISAASGDCVRDCRATRCTPAYLHTCAHTTRACVGGWVGVRVCAAHLWSALISCWCTPISPLPVPTLTSTATEPRPLSCIEIIIIKGSSECAHVPNATGFVQCSSSWIVQQHATHERINTMTTYITHAPAVTVRLAVDAHRQQVHRRC
jgi:hypothetical protein